MTEILTMWTETNAEARRAAIESHFEEDVRFIYADGEFAGFDGIEAFSDSLPPKPLSGSQICARPASANTRRLDPRLLAVRTS
jgi:hypothetical protein